MNLAALGLLVAPLDGEGWCGSQMLIFMAFVHDIWRAGLEVIGIAAYILTWMAGIEVGCRGCWCV